jgi:hypothetical protein
MYELQKSIIKQKIKEMSDKVGLKKRPKVKFSNKEKLASTKIFWNELTVGEYLLSQWQKGVFEEKDVDASLAHEFGHRIDFSRNFQSVIFRCFFLLLIYVSLGLILTWLSSLVHLPNFWMIPLLVFVILVVFLPWILVKTGAPPELEADRNAVKNKLISAEEMAKSIIKKSSYTQTRKNGPFETFMFMINMLSYPSTTERLRNLGFEIKKPVEIQKIT